MHGQEEGLHGCLHQGVGSPGDGGKAEFSWWCMAGRRGYRGGCVGVWGTALVSSHFGNTIR